MSDLFNVGHAAQLHEIQKARLARNEPGIGPEVEELIRRLTSGGVAGKVVDDIRLIQAKRFFDRGFGRELGLKDFAAYLATIPTVPETLLADDPNFPLLVLGEPRLGLTRACELIGLRYTGSDQTLVPFDKRHAEPTKPWWFSMHDGRRNRNRKPSDCRTSLGANEISATALRGVCTFLHHPGVIVQGEHCVDLPGSVDAEYRGYNADLGIWRDEPRLYRSMSGFADLDYGSASCREC